MTDLTSAASPEEIVSVAAEALKQGSKSVRDALDRLPMPIYTTDRDGRITYFNRACVEFAGRTPTLGRDSWCVTWKLYTEEGEFLPHDQCPMAVAIRQKKIVRGASAVAERPDGSRVTFIPYPTPLLDDDGEVIGAVNMFVDISQRRQIQHLREQAQRCRRLALGINDERTVTTLSLMAAEFDDQVRALDRVN